MALEPSEEDLQLVIATTSLSRHQAIILLKNFNNEAERAVDEFFNDAESALRPKQDANTWTETDNLPTFQIDATDTQASNIHPALSRPPSRASYRSPAGTNEPIDLTAAHAAADPSKSITSDEQRDIDIALKLSLGGEIQPGQESGIIGTGQRFGPAQSAYHDPKRWAMVTTSATAQEVADNPPPEFRRRKAEEPAFLRPSHRSGYLHSLLTIYHSIPLARAALLMPSIGNVSYGYDSEWWSGARIVAPKVSYDEGMVPQSDWNDFVYETQRLMAFLDGTTRSYGSADVLADMDCYQNCNADSELSQFFQTWMHAALALAPDDQLTQIFSSVALKNPRNTRTQVSQKEFACLEPNHRLGQETLYDTLDTAIWGDGPDLPLDDVWIEHIGPIFTMRVHDDLEPNPALRREKVDVKVPAIWYPDRYLESCKQLSREMRARKMALSRDIHKLQLLQNRCSTQPGPNGPLDVQQTLLEAAKAAERAVKDRTLPNGLSTDDETLSLSTQSISNVEGDHCAQELRKLAGRIDKKVRSLEEQKERTREVFRAVTKQLTQPSSDPKEAPTHKYTLRGVSTKPYITYVLRPVVEDLMDLGGDANGDEHGDEQVDEQMHSHGEPNRVSEDGGKWQWWRVSFSNQESHTSEELPIYGPAIQAGMAATETPAADGNDQYSEWSRKIQQPENRSCFSVRKVREVEVLKAAREESNSVLLVYANNDAVKLDPSRIPDLTPELRAFVELDNAAFERELRGESGAEMRGLSIADEAGKLIDDDDMETMPPSSPKRASDGASSPPKRFKGFDDHFTRLPTPPDDPPPYEAVGSNEGQEMEETSNDSSPLTTVRSNRIGQHAERMMARIEESDEDESARDLIQL